MNFTDKTLACTECGNEFTFTSGEQEFYSQRGFTNEPKRCPTCRESRKNDRRGGGGGSGGGGYGGGFGDREQRQMHKTVCANCGKTAMVPFMPRGTQPVYCDDCFRQNRQRSY